MIESSDGWTVKTYPVSAVAQPAVAIAASWTDPNTGQAYVHRDLEPCDPDWTVEQHIGVTKLAETFGDIASWAAYIKRFAVPDDTFISWNSRGITATLDYPTSDTPNRCQWKASYYFTHSREWHDWSTFASGAAITQKVAIEWLEDLGDDIVEPTQSDLLLILRSLRANATARAETTLREDGTASVSFSKDTNVERKSAGTAVDLPSTVRIAIPVLSGDKAKWEVKVRMRVSVDDSAHLTFRFSLVNAERVLEAVYAERIEEARAELGDEFPILRAGG